MQIDRKKILNLAEAISNTRQSIVGILGRVKRMDEFGLFDHKNDFARANAALNSMRDTTACFEAYLENRPLGLLNPDHYLRTYGVLQAIYIQQDAVRELGKLMKVKIDVKTDAIIDQIRELRHDVAGHPIGRVRPGTTLKGYCSIVIGSVSPDGFEYEYFTLNGVTEKRFVFLPETIGHQINFTAKWLNAFTDSLLEIWNTKRPASIST